MALPQAFDDKGDIKKYTPAELKELKGKDANLAGYESTAENLKTGQVVQVILKRHQAPKPPPADAPKKDADKDKDKDTEKEAAKDKPKEKEMPKEGANEKKFQAQVIIIIDPGDGTGGDSKMPMKTKKTK